MRPGGCYRLKWGVVAVLVHHRVDDHFIRHQTLVDDPVGERRGHHALLGTGFAGLADARGKLALWLHDYNHSRPHSALADRTPAEFAAICSGGYDGGKTALENASRLPPIHRTATAAGNDLIYPSVSRRLLETIT